MNVWRDRQERDALNSDHRQLTGGRVKFEHLVTERQVRPEEPEGFEVRVVLHVPTLDRDPLSSFRDVAYD